MPSCLVNSWTSGTVPPVCKATPTSRYTGMRSSVLISLPYSIICNKCAFYCLFAHFRSDVRDAVESCLREGSVSKRVMQDPGTCVCIAWFPMFTFHGTHRRFLPPVPRNANTSTSYCYIRHCASQANACFILRLC